MPTEKLVKLAAYPGEFEAEIVRSTLQRSGIDCFLSDSAAATTLSYAGPAVGGVKLFVYESKLASARKLLANVEEIARGTEQWYCGMCNEFQDASFDVCWKCGQDKCDGATTPPASEQAAENPIAEAPSKSSVDEWVSRAWRLAIYGLVWFPLISHLYSMYLLILATGSGESIPPKLKPKFFSAIAINACVILAVVFLIGMYWA